MQDEFIARASEVGAQVHCAESPDDAVVQIADVFHSTSALRVVVSPDLGELKQAIEETLSRLGAEFVDGDTGQALAVADLGITRAVLGIAETGSVVVAGNEFLPRLSTMLPLVHVAVLDRDKLVESLDEAGEYLRRITAEPKGRQIRYASFVSGPSRTSDVEKTLTIGVHGPGQLHIILVPRDSDLERACVSTAFCEAR